MSVLPDRRRVLGPGDTVEIPTLSEPKDISSPGSEVKSGLRPIFIGQTVAANANGTSYLEVGPIKIQCFVYGPLPIRGSFTEEGELTVDAKIAPFDDNTGNTEVEKSLEQFVESAVRPSVLVNQYPKSAINIHLNILSGAGHNCKSLMAAATNAASVALADSGIALKDIVTAASVAYDFDTKTAELDPVDPSPTEAVASFTNALDSLCTSLYVTGDALDPEELTAVVREACSGAAQVRALINDVLKSNYEQRKA